MCRCLTCELSARHMKPVPALLMQVALVHHCGLLLIDSAPYMRLCISKLVCSLIYYRSVDWLHTLSTCTVPYSRHHVACAAAQQHCLRMQCFATRSAPPLFRLHCCVCRGDVHQGSQVCRIESNTVDASAALSVLAGACEAICALCRQAPCTPEDFLRMCYLAALWRAEIVKAAPRALISRHI